MGSKPEGTRGDKRPTRHSQRLPFRLDAGSTIRSLRESYNNILRRGYRQISSLDPGSSSGYIPAAYKIPVEIWEPILHGAIASPLLPFDEKGEILDSFMTTYALFTSECSLFRTYRDTTQATIISLSLVCRLWARILQPYTQQCAFTDHKLTHFPSHLAMKEAKRVFISEFETCRCWEAQMASCPLRPLDINGTRRMPSSIIGPYMPIKLESAQIVAIGHLIDTSLDFLQTLPSLRALSIPAPTWMYGWNAPLLFAMTPQLTHLHISGVGAHSFRPNATVTLPRLRSLTLDFAVDMPYSQNDTSFRRLKAPLLRTLHARGTWVPNTRQAFYELASQHGETLTELIDATRIERNQTLPSASFWMTCPLLEIYGIDLEAVFDNSRGRNVMNTEQRNSILSPLTLVVYDITIQWDHGSHIDPNAAFDRLEEVIRKLKAEKIVSVYSWEDIERNRVSAARRINGRSTRERRKFNKIRKEFSSMLKTIGIPIYDRCGVLFSDAIRTRYL